MATATAEDRARTKALLGRWRGDICQWAEDVVVIQRPDTGQMGPLRLEPHQASWLQRATQRDRKGRLVKKTVAASWPKREGKSLVVALLGGHRLDCFGNQREVALANSERQAASVIYDEVVGFFRNSPLLAGWVTEDDIGTRTLRIPKKANQLVCVPCNYRTVQGIGVDLLLADELHAVQDIRAYNYLAAQTEMADAQVAISSQAGSPDLSNPVYRLWLARDEPHILFDYSAEHLTPWGIALANRQRAELTPAEFDALHRNLWIGLGQKLFPTDLLEAAAMDYPEPRTYSELQELIQQWGFKGWRVTIGAGLDRALVSATGDASVLTATARFSPPADGRGFNAETQRTQSTDAERETAGWGKGEGSEEFRALRQWVFRTGSRAEIMAAFRELEMLCGPLSVRTIMETFNCSDLVNV